MRPHLPMALTLYLLVPDALPQSPAGAPSAGTWMADPTVSCEAKDVDCSVQYGPTRVIPYVNDTNESDSARGGQIQATQGRKLLGSWLSDRVLHALHRASPQGTHSTTMGVSLTPGHANASLTPGHANASQTPGHANASLAVPQQGGTLRSANHTNSKGDQHGVGSTLLPRLDTGKNGTHTVTRAPGVWKGTTGKSADAVAHPGGPSNSSVQRAISSVSSSPSTESRAVSVGNYAIAPTSAKNGKQEVKPAALTGALSGAKGAFVPLAGKGAEKPGEGKRSDKPGEGKQKTGEGKHSVKPGQGNVVEKHGEGKLSKKAEEGKSVEPAGEGKHSDKPGPGKSVEKPGEGKLSEKAVKGKNAKKSKEGKHGEKPGEAGAVGRASQSAWNKTKGVVVLSKSTPANFTGAVVSSTSRPGGDISAINAVNRGSNISATNAVNSKSKAFVLASVQESMDAKTTGKSGSATSLVTGGQDQADVALAPESSLSTEKQGLSGMTTVGVANKGKAVLQPTSTKSGKSNAKEGENGEDIAVHAMGVKRSSGQKSPVPQSPMAISSKNGTGLDEASKVGVRNAPMQKGSAIERLPKSEEATKKDWPLPKLSNTSRMASKQPARQVSNLASLKKTGRGQVNVGGGGMGPSSPRTSLASLSTTRKSVDASLHLVSHEGLQKPAGAHMHKDVPIFSGRSS